MNTMVNIAEAHPYLCWLMAQLQIDFRNVFKSYSPFTVLKLS